MTRVKIALTLVTLLSVLLLGLQLAAAQSENVELVMATWRTEDVEAWETLIAAFTAEHPNISIRLEPIVNTEYATVLGAAFEAGTAPDLVHCYPFDQFLNFYNRGYLADISDVPGIEHFTDTAKSGWLAEDGETVYCMPIASVMHGFYYNADMFAENGWQVPTTMGEFRTLLQTIKDAGIVPLAMGTKDGWTNSVIGLNLIGMNYWNGEEGRQALINGEASLTDAPFIAAFEELASWKDYMPQGHEALSYADVSQLFLLGQAAIWPTGSWEISNLSENADFTVGLFRNPVVDENQETCWIYDFIDMAAGISATTEHPEEARQFIEWVTTPEFSTLFLAEQPGFMTLSDHPVTIDNPMAEEFVSWRGECQGSLRLFDQFLSRGEPSVGTEAFRVLPTMIQGGLTPQQAAEELQSYLWYPEQ